MFAIHALHRGNREKFLHLIKFLYGKNVDDNDNDFLVQHTRSAKPWVHGAMRKNILFPL
jgi:hypothetical protein